MKKTRYPDQQKARIALEAIKGIKTLSQISSQYQVHPTQVVRWRDQALKGLASCFSKDNQKDKTIAEQEQLIQDLYQIIGQREIELNWLKKKVNSFKS